MKFLVPIVLMLLISSCRSWCHDRYFKEETVRDTKQVELVETIPGEKVNERISIDDRDTPTIEGKRGQVNISFPHKDSMDVEKDSMDVEFEVFPDTVRIDTNIVFETMYMRPDCPEVPSGVTVPRSIFWPWAFITSAALLLIGVRLRRIVPL